MPELPEVETWRRLAHVTSVGRRIVEAHTANDRKVMDQDAPAELAERLRGRVIRDTGRKGKHMWITFDTPGALYLHFGMSGSLHHLPADTERPSHEKLRLLLDDGTILLYRNPRRIGKLRWYADIHNAPPIRALGPDPLLEGLPLPWLCAELARRSTPIKAVLLDQSLFAGVGNWIADEVLFQARIHPRTPARDLDADRVRLLRQTLLRILRKAVAVGADDRRFPKSWMFHTRWGKQAVTTLEGETIRYEQIGGRTCAWVPGRQV